MAYQHFGLLLACCPAQLVLPDGECDAAAPLVLAWFVQL